MPFLATIGQMVASTISKQKQADYDEKVAIGNIGFAEKRQRYLAAAQLPEDEYQAFVQGRWENYVKMNPPITMAGLESGKYPSIKAVIEADLYSLETLRDSYLSTQKLNEIVTAATTTQMALAEKIEQEEKAISAPAISAPAISTPATSAPAASAPAISIPATSAPATSAPATISPGLTAIAEPAAQTNYLPIIIIGIAIFYFMR